MVLPPSARCCETNFARGGTFPRQARNARFWGDESATSRDPGWRRRGALDGDRDYAVWADNCVGARFKDPELGCLLAGHLILLARRGIYIIENLALDELAASGQNRFEFVCSPLKLVGATGSPVRPLAVVSP